MIKQQHISQNLRAYYVSRLDWIALILVGIIDIWTQHGLDLAQILLLQGIFALFVMFLEFPTGILADLTQRKYLLVAAYVAIIMGILTYFIADSFLWFTIAELFFAIGLAGKSGADTAHIYDSYLEQDQQNRAEEVLASGKSIVYAGIMIMTALGGILAAIDWRIPLIIASIGYLITVLMYTKGYEPERMRVEDSSTAIKDTVKYLSNPAIIKLGLLMIFVNVFLRISFWDYVPRMELLNVDPFWFGIVLAGANAIAFITSLIMRKYKKLIDLDLLFILGGVVGLVLYLNQSSLIVVLTAILLHQIYRGGSNVIFAIKINEHVNSGVRASLSSLISAVVQGIYFLVIAVLNLMDLSDYGIHQLNALMGGFIGIWIIIISYNERNKQFSHSLNPLEVIAD